jgi:hypothetical protein
VDRIDTDFIERSPETNLIYGRRAQSRRKQCVPMILRLFVTAHKPVGAHTSDAAASIKVRCNLTIAWNFAATSIAEC